MSCINHLPNAPMKTRTLTTWGVGLQEINRLWEHTLGKGVKVALLGTGITPNHPDLTHAVKAKQCRDFTGSVYGVRDIRGHGTHCAGIICGRHTGERKIGLVPEADLMVAKVLPDRRPANESVFVEALEWAVESGADVISINVGQQTETSVLHEAITLAIDAGKFVFCSAGNDFRNKVDFPAAFPETIAVGSIGMYQNRSCFSSGGVDVDVVAPGEGILSTYPPYGYRFLNGTSVATAFVAGVGTLAIASQRAHHSAFVLEDPLNPSGNQQRMKEFYSTKMIGPGSLNDGTAIISIEADFE